MRIKACSTELKKQVLPKLTSPSGKFDSILLYSDSGSFDYNNGIEDIRGRGGDVSLLQA